jgi:hypothetical protein
LQYIDTQRLSEDSSYGLKAFLFGWAFERAGAPRGYRIAAAKSVSSLGQAQGDLPRLFKKYWHGKVNAKLNPMLDPALAKLSVPAIVKMVRAGAIETAFQSIDIRGIGPKIRAFFLRDLVTLLNAESKLERNLSALILCQPIDVWVRFAAKELPDIQTSLSVPAHLRKLGLNSGDLAVAARIIELSKKAGVSPLKVNQGIWYFSAYVVSDRNRLQQLIADGHPDALEEELRLMAGFMPVQPMWG